MFLLLDRGARLLYNILMIKLKRKVLFVIPPITPKERYEFADVGYHMPPLGVSYMASILRNEGVEVDILDCPVLDLTVDDLMEKIRDYDPDIVGFTTLTPTFKRVILASEKIKKHFPQKKIVIGGHYPTIKKVEILKENKNIDMVVYGEGERTIVELVEAIEGKKNLKEVNGLIYRNKEGKIIKNKKRDLVTDLDSLPLPARDLLPMERYKPAPHHYKELPVCHIIAARGCPYQCTFCAFTQIAGKKVRYRSPESVIEEMKYLVDKYGAKEIILRSEMITANRKWVEEFTEKLIADDFEVRWMCYCRVDSVDYELLKKMKEAGCWQIFYGIESGVQKLLDKVKKGTTLEQARKAVKWTKKAGIEMRASFMLFMPGETPELTQKTIDFALELDPDYAQFAPTTPFPGTALHKEAQKHGQMILNHDKYTTHKIAFVPEGYDSIEQMEEMYKKAYFSFYRRPSYALRRLKKISNWTSLKRSLMGLKVILSLMNPFN